MNDFTYAEVGATFDPENLPAGYHHLHYSTRIGAGAEVFGRSAEAILTWRMHRATGVRLTADKERAEPGVGLIVTLGIAGRGFAAPCRVVDVFEDEHRAGFAYGTLAGHPESGEERFSVELSGDGVIFTVTAFSKPARWFTTAAGPIVPVLQRLYARRLGRALRRLATRP